jgi:hypothetical protein
MGWGRGPRHGMQGDNWTRKSIVLYGKPPQKIGSHPPPLPLEPVVRLGKRISSMGLVLAFQGTIFIA